MSYYIFSTKEEAEKVSMIIMQLGSVALHLQKNIKLNERSIAIEGICKGFPVPLGLDLIWDSPKQCAEGWAIFAPYTWCIEYETPLWQIPLTAPLSLINQILNLPPPEENIEVTYTGKEWVLLAISQFSFIEKTPTFLEVGIVEYEVTPAEDETVPAEDETVPDEDKIAPEEDVTITTDFSEYVFLTQQKDTIICIGENSNPLIDNPVAPDNETVTTDFSEYVFLTQQKDTIMFEIG